MKALRPDFPNILRLTMRIFASSPSNGRLFLVSECSILRLCGK
jgi:hypothetical protein